MRCCQRLNSTGRPGAVRSVLCASIRQEGPRSPKQVPEPRRRSVFAGHELYDNAECEHCDGRGRRQSPPQDQPPGGRSARQRTARLLLEVGTIRPGDAREHHAVLSIHSRCNEMRRGRREPLPEICALQARSRHPQPRPYLRSPAPLQQGGQCGASGLAPCCGVRRSAAAAPPPAAAGSLLRGAEPGGTMRLSQRGGSPPAVPMRVL